MINRVYYASQGVFVSDTRNITDKDFIHGVQSLSISRNSENITFHDNGRPDRNFDSYLEPSNEITIQRICTNRDDLFSIVLASQPASYNDGKLIKPTNFGYTITGDDSTDIKQFDIYVAYDSSDQPSISDNPLDVLLFKRCLLTSYELDMSASGIFNQTLSFSNKIAVPSAESFDISSLPLQAVPSTRKDFDLINSVLPGEVTAMSSFGDMLDGQEVYGITGIRTSLNLSYKEHTDNGLWGGATNDEEVNLWTSLDLPLEIKVSFTINAKRGQQFDIAQSNANFSKSPIKLVFKFTDLNENNKYYVLDLGPNNKLVSITDSSTDVNSNNMEYILEYQNFTNDFSVYIQDEFS